MHYYVEMKIAGNLRAKTPEEGVVFIEQYILPTLEICKKYESEDKIIAGGPAVGAIQLNLVVQANSEYELDALLTSLPVWPLMETQIIPLTSFDGRAKSLAPGLDKLKSIVRKAA